MSEHQFGEAKNVVKFEGENLEFDKSGLQELFLHPEIKDRKIVVFSIVGAYRKGKSFFLDYCLRYLYANVSRFQFVKFHHKLINNSISTNQ